MVRDNRPSGQQEWYPPAGVEPDSLPAIVARNLWNLMSRAADLQSQLAVAKRAKVGQATVDRILACEEGTRLSSLDKIAAAFGVATWTLLHPDPENALKGVEFYAKMRQEFDPVAR